MSTGIRKDTELVRNGGRYASARLGDCGVQGGLLGLVDGDAGKRGGRDVEMHAVTGPWDTMGFPSVPPTREVGHMTGNQLQDIEKVERSLWESADQLRANSNLSSSEYCMPALGIIFLRHAANRYDAALAAIKADQAAGKMPKRALVKADFLKRRALMLPGKARYDELLKLPKGHQPRHGPGRGHERHRGGLRAAQGPASQRLRALRS